MPAQHPCIRCDDCASVCPEALQPQQLLFFSRNNMHDDLQAQGLLDCTECGACEAACPSQIPLVTAFQQSKTAISAQRQVDAQAAAWRQRFERHQARREWDKVRQQERKLEKLQGKLRDIADGESISRAPAAPAAQIDASSPAIASKTPAQIKADIQAAVARAQARKAALKANDETGESQS